VAYSVHLTWRRWCACRIAGRMKSSAWQDWRGYDGAVEETSLDDSGPGAKLGPACALCLQTRPIENATPYELRPSDTCTPRVTPIPCASLLARDKLCGAPEYTSFDAVTPILCFVVTTHLPLANSSRSRHYKRREREDDRMAYHVPSEIPSEPCIASRSNTEIPSQQARKRTTIR
jgi:hypothetical protein